MTSVPNFSITASLVIYKPDLSVLEKTLLALQAAGHTAKAGLDLTLALTIVDNSCDLAWNEKNKIWLDTRRPLLPSWDVDIRISPANVGYGKGNNLVIDTIESNYHLVLNPDLFVEKHALLRAVTFLEDNREFGLLTPAVFGVDGQRHYLCKRHPTLFIMYLRSFSSTWLQSIFRTMLAKFEMRDCDYDKPIFDVEYPTGSCMIFRTSTLKQINGFDQDYFLHYEDADIGRRSLMVARTIYLPGVKVVHKWARDTHQTWKSKLVTVKSGLIYWRKWNSPWRSRRCGHVVLPVMEGLNRQMPAELSRSPAANRDKTILVTGANGFIGRAVCATLSRMDYKVKGVMRREAGALLGKYVECLCLPDMDENTDWADILQGVHSVVHLAARVHLMHDTAKDPLAAFRLINVDLTLRLARQAAEKGVKRFVFVSSVKVNGEITPSGQPFTPADRPKPTDPYGISKHEAEQGLLALAAETGMEVVIIRPVLVYGPGVKANFQSMMYWIWKGLPLPLGSLSNRRSFLAVENLVDLIAVCLEHPAAANEIFLASDGQDMSISWLLRQTGWALNKPARLIPVPLAILRIGAKMLGRETILHRLCESLQVDISKNLLLLGWIPPVRIEQGLKKTAKYFVDSCHVPNHR